MTDEEALKYIGEQPTLNLFLYQVQLHPAALILGSFEWSYMKSLVAAFKLGKEDTVAKK